jgi:hypothetical protein
MAQSIAENKYFPSYIESVRIVNVNIENWSVDAVSVFGNKRFFDIQVMSPYFHFMNGEGIYVMPEVGAMAWLCKPSSGKFGAPFLLGYQAPFDEDTSSFRNSRQSLNPGDIMMRTRDENFMILRRGGVVQLGATPTCQTMYVPIRNMLKNFCENYELNTFGGEMTWFTDRTDQTTDGSAPTVFTLAARERANDQNPVATLTMGSHGEGNPTTLRIAIKESSQKSAAVTVDLTLGKDGNVKLEVKKNVSVLAESFSVVTSTGDVSFNSGKNFDAVCKGTMALTATGGVKVSSPATVEIAGATSTVIGGGSTPVLLGGSSAKYQTVRGAGPSGKNTLTTFLTDLIELLNGKITSAAPGSPVVPDPSLVVKLTNALPSLVSQNTFTG